MNIPTSRTREFDQKEINLINEAIVASGLDGGLLNITWEASAVRFDHGVEIMPAIFDCRGPLNTPCWVVNCAPAVHTGQPCACGSVTREPRDGVYGSLKAAVATALAELVRARVLANIPDSSDPVLKTRPSDLPPATSNDFISHCLHS